MNTSNLVKKSLIFAISILFIVTAIVPITSGNIEKISIQLNSKVNIVRLSQHNSFKRDQESIIYNQIY